MLRCVCTYASIRPYEHKEVYGKAHIKLLMWIIWVGKKKIKQIKRTKKTIPKKHSWPIRSTLGWWEGRRAKMKNQPTTFMHLYEILHMVCIRVNKLI